MNCAIHATGHNADHSVSTYRTPLSHQAGNPPINRVCRIKNFGILRSPVHHRNRYHSNFIKSINEWPWRKYTPYVRRYTVTAVMLATTICRYAFCRTYHHTIIAPYIPIEGTGYLSEASAPNTRPTPTPCHFFHFGFCFGLCEKSATKNITLAHNTMRSINPNRM